ncbi:UNVERIFIED_CONTAM: cell division protein FtsI/penicillin-binding protein 2 [Brevibacillus sp. OAP136]
MGEKKEHQSHIPTRLNILFVVVFLFFAIIILRLAFVQLVEGEQYKHDLEKYSTRELPIPAPRGRILDANGEVLVANKPVYTVTFVEDQNQSINQEQVADKLAGILKENDEKPGTDKELVKKALEYKATLPVSFNAQDTAKLISRLVPYLNSLPKAENVDRLNDSDLIKTALKINQTVRSPLDGDGREKLKSQVKAAWKTNAPATDLQDVMDGELMKYAIQYNLAIPARLDDKDRENLAKEVKAGLRLLPEPANLKERSDMDLLKYAAMFDLDVPLNLTEEQRLFQWRKMGILKEMRSYGIASYIPRRVKVNISHEEMFQIEERRSELPGINVILEPLREIHKDPDGTGFGTHFLGYIKPIRPEMLTEYVAQGYSRTDMVGETGLERFYERTLRGKDGASEVHVNKDSQTVEKRQKRDPEPGNDLVLALDWKFQSKVESILMNHIEDLKKRPSTPKELRDAHVLVMNPTNGEILAMASYPDYDLNLYYDQEEFNKQWKTLILPNELNHFIGSSYPPASTYKPLSVMMALQEGLTTPGETVMDRGGLKVGNVFMRNWKAGGHGPVNARRALQVSNNTYMYTMAVRLADRAMNNNMSYTTQFSVLDYYNAQFGLGVKTGVDLPYESAGWPNPNNYYGNLAHALIGQYDLFTPMQMGQYVSAIANGGYRIRPHLVKEIRKGTTDLKKPGQTLTIMETEVLNRVQIDPQWIKVVQEGMHMVTQPGGTASGTFRGLPFEVAAKTGTAQLGKKAENALMVGYAPYQNPQLAFVVLVPNSIKDGGHSSDASGPIARKILEAYNEMYPGKLTPAPVVPSP